MLSISELFFQIFIDVFLSSVLLLLRLEPLKNDFYHFSGVSGDSKFRPFLSRNPNIDLILHCAIYTLSKLSITTLLNLITTT